MSSFSKNTFSKIIYLFILLTSLFFNISTAFAVPPPIFFTLRGIQVESGLAGGTYGTEPSVVIGRIIYVVLGVLGIIFTGLIIYAGFLWMTAGGNEEKIKKAKVTITRAVIGLIIVLAAYSITWFIITRILETTIQKTL